MIQRSPGVRLQAVAAAAALMSFTLSSNAYEPINPPIRAVERELFIRCASGAVQTKLSGTRALVMPAVSRTNAPAMQSLVHEAFVKTAGDLSLEAYPGDESLNAIIADPKLYDFVIKGEFSMIDRAVTTDELKKEFGVDFGGGRGAGFLGVPSTERWTVGWVTATVTLYRTDLRKATGGATVGAVRLAASAEARSAFFTLGNSDGINASVVVTYGQQTTVEAQAGMQRAAISALRAAAARTMLQAAGYQGYICGL